LIDDEDTLEHYEAIGKEKDEIASKEAEEEMKKKMKDLGHVGQIEMIAGKHNITLFIGRQI